MTVKSEYEQVVRVAITGSTYGPNIYRIMEILGREEVMRRLKCFFETHVGRVLVVDGEDAPVPWVIPPMKELLGYEDPKKRFMEDLAEQRKIYLDPHT